MKRALVLSLGLFISMSVSQAEDLKAVYDRALSNDPQIREAGALRLAARESKPQALAALLPQISASATLSDSESDSTRVTFRAPHALAGFIAPKGSVALNGTSLTVNEVEGTDFGINFIPHTQAATTWGAVAIGDHVNLEIDTMARYVARLRDWAKE